MNRLRGGGLLGGSADFFCETVVARDLVLWWCSDDG